MKKTYAVLRGKKNKSQGRAFEHMFEHSLRKHKFAYDKMPDGCRQLGAFKLIRVKTPYDWIITLSGRTALIDTKSFIGDKLIPSQVTPHQAQSMRLHANRGAIAGYVIWFRDHNSVRFAESCVLDQITASKTGILFSYLVDLGSIQKMDLLGIFRKTDDSSFSALSHPSVP